MFNPKTQEKLNNYNYLRDQERNGNGKVGIIQSYDPVSNTATVLTAANDSDVPNDIITDVMCPVFPGIQMVAPEPGRPCWIVMKSGFNDRRAMISHFFNHNFSNYDYSKQYSIRSGIPSYMRGI